jgi:DNA repair protein RecN (Recombination protein N)
MIKRLSIRNYAIIEELEIEFPTGLTIITGETGAGKSILLGALGLIMGERADSKTLFIETEKCVVEGVFQVSAYGLKDYFDENDLDYQDECVIRRELLPSGKSRAFVNDTPVNLETLKQLTSALIDLHEQFDTLDIHQVSFQLRMVDALAGNVALLEAYQLHYRNYIESKKRLEKLKEQSLRAAQESEFLVFQHGELAKAELSVGELERLEEEQKKLSNAGEIKRVLSTTFHAISESEMPVSGQLRDILRAMSDIARFHPIAAEIYKRLEGLTLELEDLGTETGKLADQTELDPARIHEIQNRLDVIYRLLKKHRVQTVEELLDIEEATQKKLDALGDLTADIEKLEAAISAQVKLLQEKAARISESRKSAIPGFEQKVLESLRQLAMQHARFQIECRELPHFNATGTDELNFMFAANPGSRMQLIKDAASGGELSRLTLVTKSLVASAIPLPTLIFDEIDAGVGGDVALRMGGILRRLANQHQVIIITHSPQVASKADAHYFVYKQIEQNQTFTRVKLLNNEERVRSIAVMLSQNPPSEAAIANARELMSS